MGSHTGYCDEQYNQFHNFTDFHKDKKWGDLSTFEQAAFLEKADANPDWFSVPTTGQLTQALKMVSILAKAAKVTGNIAKGVIPGVNNAVMVSFWDAIRNDIGDLGGNENIVAMDDSNDPGYCLSN